MTRIPPSLLYLTIYNPTLRPDEPYDDEDAEEQAHILFYTSRETAVSRDRMLRQVGLAKALVNFSQQFGGGEPCRNIHSQCRRMLMVSPEPDFWIHVCIDLAKVPRVPEPTSKSKPKAKDDKGKADMALQFDYEDGSVDDGAIRARLMKGYEVFQLAHGSFVSILTALGQQALQLQLERFWTIWAWSWNMEIRSEFAECFGPQLHPYFASLIPIVNEFAQNLSPDTTPVILSLPYIIPSTRYNEGRHPSVLAHHLSTLIPRSSSSSGAVNALAASVETIRARRKEDSDAASGRSDSIKVLDMKGANFMGVKMDVRKWAWPYLTFGRGSSIKPSVDKILLPPEGQAKQDELSCSDSEREISQVEVEVDVNADDLQDAITSDPMSLSSRTRRIPIQIVLDGSPLKGGNSSAVLGEETTGEDAVSTDIASDRRESTPSRPEFSLTRLHLSSRDNPTATKRVSIHYFIRNGHMLSLLHLQEQTDEGNASASTDLEYASENVTKLFDDIDASIHELDMRGVATAKPLQTQNQYLICAGQYMFASPGFKSDSSHLFNAKAILDNDPGIHEIFSRGQNPQHWHIAKHGFGGTKPSVEYAGVQDEVFMEVFKQEASLTDVDNVLTGVVKKSGIVGSCSGVR